MNKKGFITIIFVGLIALCMPIFMCIMRSAGIMHTITREYTIYEQRYRVAEGIMYAAFSSPSFSYEQLKKRDEAQEIACDIANWLPPYKLEGVLSVKKEDKAVRFCVSLKEAQKIVATLEAQARFNEGGQAVLSDWLFLYHAKK
jgi:hypothetical protein